jgi:hypothetical protein
MSNPRRASIDSKRLDALGAAETGEPISGSFRVSLEDDILMITILGEWWFFIRLSHVRMESFQFILFIWNLKVFLISASSKKMETGKRKMQINDK